MSLLCNTNGLSQLNQWIDLRECGVSICANIVCLSAITELATLLKKIKLDPEVIDRTYLHRGGGEHQQTLSCDVVQLIH